MRPALPADISASDRVAAVREALPAEGFFAEKEWLLSPDPFPLSPRTVRRLEQLGPQLLRFQRAADRIYHRSRKRSLPAWIADYLDRGKPAALLEVANDPRIRDRLPRVIRPDLILTETGIALTELDSVPGGIGLTAWLGQTYGGLVPETAPLAGGADGMLRGFASIFPGNDGADLVISEESAAYRPEMAWLAKRLAKRLGDGWAVKDAESYRPAGRDVYRFFELFDLANLPHAMDLARAAADGEIDLTAPFKPHLEEKMWSALFWMRPLREVWRRELRDSHWQRLRQLVPRSWIVDPAPLPHHAVIPELEINDFAELKEFSQHERELVLKISGFSELGWGSRSVSIGSDLSHREWSDAVDTALAAFDRSPYVLQRFHKGRLVRHPYWDPDTGSVRVFEGRVRLCPYYFIEARNPESIRLGGVLATICPADKKILHGMKDAIMAPCAVDEEGY